MNRTPSRAPIGIGSAIRGVGQDVVEGGVGRTTPHRLSGAIRRQADLLLKEPQQRLPNRAALAELAEHQSYCFLNALVGIDLKSLVLGSEESNRRGHNQLAASGLGQSRVLRTLAEQIQFVLVERPLQAQQESVVAQ